MKEDEERSVRMLPLYAIALVIACGGAAVGYACGLAQLLVRP
ncbi:hypothetical protein [Novosphingobium gossypii]